MAKEKNPAYGNKIRTGECFANFPHLKEPDNGREYSDNKYKLDCIFINDASMAGLKAECESLAKINFGSITDVKFPWKNGDEGTTSKFQGYPGHRYITPKTGADKPPMVVGPNPKIAFDPAKIYGGAIIKANITPKAYTMTDEVMVIQPDGIRVKEKVKTQGITLYLNAVQFVRDSERFGGGDDPTGGFDDESNGAIDDNSGF